MIDEARQDRWVAALCHASVVVFLFGAIVPLVVWITQKDRSRTLRFQALQGLIYQLSGILVYFLLNGFMMLTMLVMMIGVFISGALKQDGVSSIGTSADSLAALLPLLWIVFMFLFTLVIMVGGPIYLISGLWAAVRILRGADFRYPLLGRFLASRLDRNSLHPLEAT